MLFLVYINDLPDGLGLLAKLFADDTSLLSTASDFSLSASLLNNDFTKKCKWAHKWKMTFNPDITKPPKEVKFPQTLLFF